MEASGTEMKGVCIKASMYALWEQCVHITQEVFEMAVAKVMQKDSEKNMSIKKLWEYVLWVDPLNKGLCGKTKWANKNNGIKWMRLVRTPTSIKMLATLYHIHRSFFPWHK